MRASSSTDRSSRLRRRHRAVRPRPLHRGATVALRLRERLLPALSQVDGKYVVKDTFGYRTIATYAGATPFRMQATALGRYLLYGPTRGCPRRAC